MVRLEIKESFETHPRKYIDSLSKALIILCFVLVQLMKTRNCSDMTEKLLIRRKASTQTNKQISY